MNISKNRLNKIRKISDSDLDYSDIPELSKEFWDSAKVVDPAKKVPISLRLDEDVVRWFKKTGKGYQSRINAVLSSYVNTKTS